MHLVIVVRYVAIDTDSSTKNYYRTIFRELGVQRDIQIRPIWVCHWSVQNFWNDDFGQAGIHRLDKGALAC
eukprot:5524020-Amphidinium_carterae.1